jgi:hypothetical protein
MFLFRNDLYLDILYECTKIFEDDSNLWGVNTAQAQVWCYVVLLYGKRCPILTVSIAITSNLVTVQLRWCCVQLCSYMGEDVHFDGLRSINQQACHSTVALCCLQLCSYMGKDVHFDGLSCINLQACQRTVALCCLQLCSYIGKDVHFDGLSCNNQQACDRTVALRCVQLYGEGCPF